MNSMQEEDVPEEERLTPHLDSMSSRTSSDLWIAQLSMTTTEFLAGQGCMPSRRVSMNAAKESALNEPSMITHSSIPSREIAVRTEYLHDLRAHTIISS